jgi:hypothetical protein
MSGTEMHRDPWGYDDAMTAMERSAARYVREAGGKPGSLAYRFLVSVEAARLRWEADRLKMKPVADQGAAGDPAGDNDPAISAEDDLAERLDDAVTMLLRDFDQRLAVANARLDRVLGMEPA